MASPLISFLTGLGTRRVVETVTPARTMADVVLAPQTHRTLEQALAQVRNHHLIFNRWGLGERHTSGRGLAFNFAGPPGTGKTICAEAIAHELGLKLLVVNYAEAESMWFGETPKNIVATSLFGDGLAAVLVDGANRDTGGISLLSTCSELIPDSLDVMGWDVTRNGLELVLSQKIDSYVRDYLPRIVERFLKENSIGFEDIDYFILHPGGPKIIRAYEEVFPLPPDALRFTRHILRCYGNMSSASVLFILKDVLDRAKPEPGQLGLMAAMGPGFAAELALLQF